ncbi:hypothetical protein QWY87_13630 [Lutimonas halocynthiae]|uniref:hypothetical protein n=1 Tax=Lutimonas halocynthiae TaxID=1446477 RepID=UPI0025B2FB1A|nr:hypothetical protein [Lutimonas halocynthiae]MDN3643752.1 hypothetical protein [Lutimonas halocynthiae]
MKIESEQDLIHFIRNSKKYSDKQIISFLNKAFRCYVLNIPEDRETLAEHLEQFFIDFPPNYEKPLIIDFRKKTQLRKKGAVSTFD